MQLPARKAVDGAANDIAGDNPKAGIYSERRLLNGAHFSSRLLGGDMVHDAQADPANEQKPYELRNDRGALRLHDSWQGCDCVSRLIWVICFWWNCVCRPLRFIGWRIS